MRRASIHHQDGLFIVRFMQTVRLNQHPVLKDVWRPAAFTTNVEAVIAKIKWELFKRF